jgi:protein TonB
MFMIGLLAALALFGEPAATPVPAVDFLIEKPEWVAFPQGNDMAAAYPYDGRSASGGATIRCRVTANGSLTACEVLSETPEGGGFGVASLKVSKFFRMKTTMKDGRPVKGGVVVIPIKWNIPGR